MTNICDIYYKHIPNLNMGLYILLEASYAFIVSIISNVHTKCACNLLEQMNYLLFGILLYKVHPDSLF